MVEPRTQATYGAETSEPQRSSTRLRSKQTAEIVSDKKKAVPKKVTKPTTVILAANVKILKKPNRGSVRKKKEAPVQKDVRSSRNGRLLRDRQCIQSPRRFQPEPFSPRPAISLPSTPVAQKRTRRPGTRVPQRVPEEKAPRSISSDSTSTSEEHSPIRIITQPWNVPEKEKTPPREITPEVENRRRKNARRSVSTPKRTPRLFVDGVLDQLRGWFSSSQPDQVTVEPNHQPSTSSQASQTPRKKVALVSLEAEEPTQQQLSLSQPPISKNVAEDWKHKVEITLQRPARKATKSPSSQSTVSSKSTRSTQHTKSSQSSQSSELLQRCQSTHSTQSAPASSQTAQSSSQTVFSSPLLPVSPTYEASEVAVGEQSRSASEQNSVAQRSEPQLTNLPSSILSQLDGPTSPSSSDNESWHSAAEKLDVTLVADLPLPPEVDW